MPTGLGSSQGFLIFLLVVWFLSVVTLEGFLSVCIHSSWVFLSAIALQGFFWCFGRNRSSCIFCCCIGGGFDAFRTGKKYLNGFLFFPWWFDLTSCAYRCVVTKVRDTMLGGGMLPELILGQVGFLLPNGHHVFKAYS